jgi:RNA polymerase sigma factor (sigma-70 family)
MNEAKRWEKYGILERDDLLQEGFRGLLVAGSRFDAGRQLKFSTYAMYCIRGHMLRALRNQPAGRCVRVANSTRAGVKKIYQQATAKAQTELGRDPTDTEVLGRLSSRHRHAVRAIRRVDESVGRRKKLVPQSAIAPDPRSSPIDGLDPQALLALLPCRERRILEWRFGLDDQGPLDMAQIGERLGLSRERIRQLIDESLLRLRAHIESANAKGAPCRA